MLLGKRQLDFVVTNCFGLNHTVDGVSNLGRFILVGSNGQGLKACLPRPLQPRAFASNTNQTSKRRANARQSQGGSKPKRIAGMAPS